MMISLDEQIECVRAELFERLRPPLKIPLGIGLTLIIEERDLWIYGFWRWNVSRGRHTRYLYRNAYPRDAKPRRYYFHREVLGVPQGMALVDHANGNGLDNRRGNLRIATRIQNNWNIQHRHRPGYRGVSFHRASGLWVARLGSRVIKSVATYHKTELEAARAFDKMSREARGDFAVLNFSEQDAADREIERMTAVLDTLEELRDRPAVVVARLSCELKGAVDKVE